MIGGLYKKLITSGRLSEAALLEADRQATPDRPLDRVLVEKGLITYRELEDFFFSHFRKRSLEDILLEEKLVDPQTLQDIVINECSSGKRLEKVLIERKIISPEDAARAIAKVYGLEYVDTTNFEVDDELFNSIDVAVMRRFTFIPEEMRGDKLSILIADPTDVDAIEELEAIIGIPTYIKVASSQGIHRLIDLMLETSLDSKLVFHDVGEISKLQVVRDESELEPPVSSSELGEENPVVRLVDSVILKAVRRRASDIHIEVYDEEVKVKYRIDGVLFEVLSNIDVSYKNYIVSRIKILANLDIAEKRIPQDGRFKLIIDERPVDFRVSVIPSIHGETVVIRILDKMSIGGLELSKLGFPENDLLRFKRAISRPYGMILVAGPTGSGKTTTLYSAVNFIKSKEKKLITIEDPVEYEFPDIVQINVNEKTGLTFACGLRSIVRQDPNQIMVGEIRDFETAAIAINAALTGHLVMSTIHANNVIDSIGRLVNMGVDPYQFVSSFNMIMSQRLVRKICESCKTQAPPPAPEERELMSDYILYEGKTTYRGAGCRYCHRTGYNGRTGIFETMLMSDSIKQMILDKISPLAIRDKAIEEGMVTLRKAAWNKVLEGQTTISEMNRVTFEE